LPLLKKVVGRQLDIIHTPDGRRIAGEFFPHLVKDFHGIGRFQVVQRALDDVRLLIVPTKAWNDGERRRLEEEIASVLGAATHYEIVVVDDIPTTPAGKHRVVVSEIGAPVREEQAEVVA
jgi:phenylacetate-CoA ligase